MTRGSPTDSPAAPCSTRRMYAQSFATSTAQRPRLGGSRSAVETHPVLPCIDTSSRLTLRLFYADSATPDRAEKPPGAQYCEIREQIGGVAPVDPESMTTLAMEGRAPYRANFEPADAGKPVWFALRWIDHFGCSGPWSPIFASAVPV
jgi:hypothetical protein